MFNMALLCSCSNILYIWDFIFWRFIIDTHCICLLVCASPAHSPMFCFFGGMLTLLILLSVITELRLVNTAHLNSCMRHCCLRLGSTVVQCLASALRSFMVTDSQTQLTLRMYFACLRVWLDFTFSVSSHLPKTFQYVPKLPWVWLCARMVSHPGFISASHPLFPD